MTDIAEFLNAQYDRIEAAAQAAANGPWRVGDVVEELGSADVYGLDGRVTSAREEPCCSVEDAEHMAINDPAYVLADIASKRRILDEVVDEATCLDMQVDGERRVGPRDTVTEPYLGDVLLRLLAAPFSGEPGYDAERWVV